MTRAKQIITGTFLAAFLAIVAIVSFAKIPANWTHSITEYKLLLTVTTAMTIFYAGAALLFVTSLSSYRTKLRFSYIMIALGIVLTALATFQYPIIDAFGWEDSAWATSGASVLPFIVSISCGYIGVRQLARLVGAKTTLTNPFVVLPIVIVISVCSAFLPHAPSAMPEISVAVADGIIVWTGVLNAVVAFMVLFIQRHIGAHYTSAMAWLCLAYASGTFILAVALIHTLLGGTSQDIGNTSLDVLSSIGGLLYIGAGYAFSRTEDI